MQTNSDTWIIYLWLEGEGNNNKNQLIHVRRPKFEMKKLLPWMDTMQHEGGSLCIHSCLWHKSADHCFCCCFLLALPCNFTGDVCSAESSKNPQCSSSVCSTEGHEWPYSNKWGMFSFFFFCVCVACSTGSIGLQLDIFDLPPATLPLITTSSIKFSILCAHLESIAEMPVLVQELE